MPATSPVEGGPGGGRGPLARARPVWAPTEAVGTGRQAAEERAGRDLDLVDDGAGGGVEDVVEAALLAGADHLLAAGEPVEVGRVAEVEVRCQRGEPRVPVVAVGALVDPDDVAVAGVE